MGGAVGGAGQSSAAARTGPTGGAVAGAEDALAVAAAVALALIQHLHIIVVAGGAGVARRALAHSRNTRAVVVAAAAAGARLHAFAAAAVVASFAQTVPQGAAAHQRFCARGADTVAVAVVAATGLCTLTPTSLSQGKGAVFAREAWHAVAGADDAQTVAAAVPCAWYRGATVHAAETGVAETLAVFAHAMCVAVGGAGNGLGAAVPSPALLAQAALSVRTQAVVVAVAGACQLQRAPRAVEAGDTKTLALATLAVSGAARGAGGHVHGRAAVVAAIPTAAEAASLDAHSMLAACFRTHHLFLTLFPRKTWVTKALAMLASAMTIAATTIR